VFSTLEISGGIEDKYDIYFDIDGAGVTVTSYGLNPPGSESQKR